MSKCTLGNLFRLRDGGAEQGVLMEAATRLQYRMRGEEVAAAFVSCTIHNSEYSVTKSPR